MPYIQTQNELENNVDDTSSVNVSPVMEMDSTQKLKWPLVSIPNAVFIPAIPELSLFFLEINNASLRTSVAL